jgi:hypothetical protein
MQNVFDSNTRFFQTLTNSRRLSRFTGQDFSAGEFPEAGKWYAFWSLSDQEAAAVLDDSDGDASSHNVGRASGRP